MNFYNRFTKEEKLLDKEDTLQMLKQGLSQVQIALELGKSTQYICNIKKDLIAENLISDEELKKIKEEKKNKEKQNLPNPINKKKLRNDKKEEKKSKILEGILSNKTPLELEKELEIPITTINRCIKELIDEKRLDENKVKKQRSKNRDSINIRNENIIKDFNTKQYTNVELAKKYNVSTALISFITTGQYEEKMNSKNKPKRKINKEITTKNDNEFNSLVPLSEVESLVLSSLKKGTIYSDIEKQANISHKELLKIIKNLKLLNIISSTEIKQAQNNRIECDKQNIVSLLKEGLSISNIISKETHLKPYYIKWLVKKIKEDNILTKEQIKDYIKNSKSKQDFKKLVLTGMEKGLNLKDIISSDTTDYATESKVRRMKETLINEGKITRKNYKKFHKKYIRTIKKEENNEYDKKIYKLIKKGLNNREIANCLGVKESFIYNKKKKILAKKLLIEEDLEEYKILRKKQNDEIRLEVKKELTSEKNSTLHRKEFIKLIKDEISYGNKIKKDDVILFGKILVLNNEFISKENLRFVVTEYFKFGTYKQINTLLCDLIIVYKDTKYEKPLRDFLDYARKNIMYKVPIKSLKDLKKNDEQEK